MKNALILDRHRYDHLSEGGRFNGTLKCLDLFAVVEPSGRVVVLKCRYDIGTHHFDSIEELERVLSTVPVQ